ncbi:MAG: AarF/ABC1/UbiB kinase family protein, partial [Acidimicrobiales bacterium]|nr:AarF/ABC1/UbiB kinase family protein [Acidimicrobiales bacterium]
MTTVDHAVGAFSQNPPWVVNPEEMSWRAGIGEIRHSTRAELPLLLQKGRKPPVKRAFQVVFTILRAFIPWFFGARRKGGEASRSDLSKRLRVAFTQLGPTYIKLGQILSSGEGIFPAEVVDEFKLLRDRVPPETFLDVRATIEQDLGMPLESIFSEFSSSPLAAASIAQVHVAKLRDGQEVVVKVQRPKISQQVRQDLAVMNWLAPFLVGRIPVSSLANPPALVELFADTILEELDFRLEAQNMLDVAEVLATTDQRSIVVPRPHPDLITRRVLVMERLSGFAWDDVAGMKSAGVNTEVVLRAGMISFLE